MKDSFGRTIDYLRLSITDRCNLRCVYCMPSRGVEWMSHDDILRFEEIARLCGIMAGMGIRKIKVTGGEPLVRRGVPALVRELKALPGIETVTLTTNGLLLGEYLDALADAGLDALNVSLDVMDEETFRRLTRFPQGDGERSPLEQILASIDRAGELKLPVKINCVPLRGVNEGDIAKLAGMAKKSVIAVRFIELMPLGDAAALRSIPADEVATLLEKEYGALIPAAVSLGNGPAEYYTLPGFAGYLGFISAVSHGFCGGCNRLRLTASGFLKPCLSSDADIDLRTMLRGGASGEKIAGAVAELVSRKPARHSFAGNGAAEHRHKQMFSIGG